MASDESYGDVDRVLVYFQNNPDDYGCPHAWYQDNDMYEWSCMYTWSTVADCRLGVPCTNAPAHCQLTSPVEVWFCCNDAGAFLTQHDGLLSPVLPG